MSSTNKKIQAEIDPAQLASSKLLELLVCPKSKGKLKYDKANQELICEKSKLAYPIKGGVPIMMESEARPI